MRWGRLRPKEGDRERVTEYEILLLLAPELPEERQTEIVGRVRGLIEEGGGTVERHEPWGRRKLAYPIEKKEDGIYHLVDFTAVPETLDELTRVLKIDDDVMRYMATRRPEGGPSEPVAVAARIGDDAGAEPADAPEEED
jgi:small subunit ribosomal protein S6